MTPLMNGPTMIDSRSMTALGLNAYEASVYMALLGRPELASADIARRAGVPRQRVYDVLGSLVSKGLCLARDTVPRTYIAVDPRIALDLLVQDRTAALEKQRAEARALAELLTAQLAPVFAAGRGQNDPLAYVEVLSGPSRIAHRALALAEAAKKSVNSCIKRPIILSHEQNMTFMKAPLGRGIRYRALFDAESMEDAEFLGWMNQFGGLGLETRITTELPLKMQAFDDEVVLISMQDPTGGEPSFTAVAIHNRGAVAMFNLAFEHLWANATAPEIPSPNSKRTRGRRK